MNKVFKDNKVLLAGVLLPIIMMILFSIATLIPKIFVAPPQYDCLFVTGYTYYNQPKLSFSVVQGRFVAQLSCDKNCNTFDMQNRSALYIFEAKTQKIREIKVQIPSLPSTSEPFVINVKIPELENLKIDTALEAPDGYVFSSAGDNSGLISELFFSSRSNQPIISKKGNIILLTPNSKTFDYYNIKFIGWIIPEQGK